MRLGIDLGSVFTKIVLMDNDGTICHLRAQRHYGSPIEVLYQFLTDDNLPSQVSVGITGVHASLAASKFNLQVTDYVQAEIAAVRSLFPKVRNIFNIGGGSVTWVQLDIDGNFLDYATNSLCAAGTGSFLDQQAFRLGITYEDLEGFSHIESPPSIATRCSVFAKTDLIHRQQEGYKKDALWSGLCRGMTHTFLNTLLRGRPLNGLSVVTGGVAQNREVIRWLCISFGDLIKTYPEASFSGAVGAARCSTQTIHLPLLIKGLKEADKKVCRSFRNPSLILKKSSYPSFKVEQSWTDDLGNEIRITDWPSKKTISGYMGIDIGSTSTKIILIDTSESVIVDIYRRTAGDPIQATKHLFTALSDICERKGSVLKILGVATTGSGRKLIGHIIGADTITNEITTHLTGAMHIDLSVDTIFEIGGQDSKYIRAKEGAIYDSNMNYVCAAGTGSFIEEQAKKLGFRLEEISNVVMGISPPITSDRCTVFMEQDVDRLIRQGYSRTECMAAVLYSVAKNYLSKVVGKRHYNRKRVFFQGATARNKGLVAAFENLLDVEVVVSPYCHVMGAYGASLLAKHSMEEQPRPTLFKGLDLSSRQITLSTKDCPLCQNHCKITYARIEGEKEQPSWGYMCGREPGANKVKVREEFKPFSLRYSRSFPKQSGKISQSAKVKGSAVTVAIPRALTTFTHAALWQKFLEELGCNVKLTDISNGDTVSDGNQICAADFCFPMKLAHGHVRRAITDESNNFVLVPHMICPSENPSTTNSFFCPYVQTLPSIMKTALNLHHHDIGRMLTPILDMRFSKKRIAGHLWNVLGPALGKTRVEVQWALEKAIKAEQEFESVCSQDGQKLLREIESSGEKALVILGRPYILLDPRASLGLPQKIADLGMRVIPMDILPIKIDDIDPAYENMYWAYGQRILTAADYVRKHPNLFAIYLSCFSCGPDSFLLSHMDEIMEGKPFLILELDEHGSDAGYMTRVEAFFDVLQTNRPHTPRGKLARVKSPILDGKKVWIPPMHNPGAKLFANVFRRFGYDAEALPTENRNIFALGRSVTRGSECLPAACTIGALIKRLEESKGQARDNIFFMPSADGPCRFGQYGLLHRNILDRSGYSQVEILSPSCYNAYRGLPQELRRLLWKAVIISDILVKCACKIRPYETIKGQTDKVLDEETKRMGLVLETGGNIEESLQRSMENFKSIGHSPFGTRPLVGIVGEIYVRCNEFCNDLLIRSIEKLGGEAWVAPVGEWILYTAHMKRWNTRQQTWRFGPLIKAIMKDAFLTRYEHRFYDIVKPLIHDRIEPPIEHVVNEGARYVPRNFYGESILTLGRASIFAHQGAKMVVNSAPFGCMPGTLTTALTRQIQEQTGVPIVSMFYDGEEGLNERLGVYMSNLISV